MRKVGERIQCMEEHIINIIYLHKVATYIIRILLKYKNKLKIDGWALG